MNDSHGCIKCINGKVEYIKRSESEEEREREIAAVSCVVLSKNAVSFIANAVSFSLVLAYSLRNYLFEFP